MRVRVGRGNLFLADQRTAFRWKHDQSRLLSKVGDGEAYIETVPFRNDGGSMEISQGSLRFKQALVQSGGQTLLAGGTLECINSFRIEGGVVSGSGSIIGNINNVAGVMSPQGSPGTLSVAGTYTQLVAATLAVDVAADAVADRLAVSGSAVIDGALLFCLTEDYTPSLGQTFTILTASSVTGTFDFLSPIFNDVNYFNVIYQSNAVLLEVLAHPHAGDANEDNIINLADLQILSDHWGLGASSDLLFDSALHSRSGSAFPSRGRRPCCCCHCAAV